MPEPENKEPIAYLVETNEIAKLRQIAARLQGGTDWERDQGQMLWLIINDVAGRPMAESGPLYSELAERVARLEAHMDRVAPEGR